MRTVRVLVRGRVQGVGYRSWVEEEAVRLGLVGWVRNRRDGVVEAVLSGEPAAIEQMLRAMRLGPPAARVSGLDVGDPVNDPDARIGPGFAVLPT